MKKKDGEDYSLNIKKTNTKGTDGKTVLNSHWINVTGKCSVMTKRYYQIHLAKLHLVEMIDQSALDNY